jgi:hypothetical protein
VPGEIEIPDDRGVEQRHGVGGDGIAETGIKLLGRRGAADDRAALKDGDREPGRREVSGRDETVVAAAGDDDVARSFARRVGHRKLLPGRAEPGQIVLFPLAPQQVFRHPA